MVGNFGEIEIYKPIPGKTIQRERPRHLGGEDVRIDDGATGESPSRLGR